MDKYNGYKSTKRDSTASASGNSSQTSTATTNNYRCDNSRKIFDDDTLTRVGRSLLAAAKPINGQTNEHVIHRQILEAFHKELAQMKTTYDRHMSRQNW